MSLNDAVIIVYFSVTYKQLLFRVLFECNLFEIIQLSVILNAL